MCISPRPCRPGTGPHSITLLTRSGRPEHRQFQAHPGNTAGGLFELRILEAE